MSKPAVLICFSVCLVLAQPINAQKSPSVEQSSDSVSPDKQWEYKCAEYGLGQCAPEIVKTGTTQVVLDLDQELNVSGPYASKAEAVWAPDSKRFAFNYSPPHPHQTTYQTVAFYQLRAEKWVGLRSPEDDLVKLAKGILPKKVHKSSDELIPDIVKVLNWTDAKTAILLSVWHPWQFSSHSNQLDAAFFLTLEFNENGNWKIVKKHRMSEKEVEKFESGPGWENTP